VVKEGRVGTKGRRRKDIGKGSTIATKEVLGTKKGAKGKKQAHTIVFRNSVMLVRRVEQLGGGISLNNREVKVDKITVCGGAGRVSITKKGRKRYCNIHRSYHRV